MFTWAKIGHKNIYADNLTMTRCLLLKRRPVSVSWVTHKPPTTSHTRHTDWSAQCMQPKTCTAFTNCADDCSGPFLLVFDYLLLCSNVFHLLTFRHRQRRKQVHLSGCMCGSSLSPCVEILHLLQSETTCWTIKHSLVCLTGLLLLLSSHLFQTPLNPCHLLSVVISSSRLT